jgi:toxin secretion/phage lysis holin
MGYLITFYFIVLDFFTGLLKAFATDSFSSKIMRRGLFHKLSLLCVLALGWLMEYAQRFVDLGIGFAVPVGTAACVYIILMEVGSILENLCQANPELMPDKLCQLFGVGNRLETTEREMKKKQLPMEEETAQAEEAEPHENQ